MVSFLILLRSLRVYILKQLFFSLSVNSGFRNSYLAASRLGPEIFSHYSPRFQRIIVKWPGNFITKLVHKTLEVNYAFLNALKWILKNSFQIWSVIFSSMPCILEAKKMRKNVGWGFKIEKVQNPFLLGVGRSLRPTLIRGGSTRKCIFFRSVYERAGIVLV